MVVSFMMVTGRMVNQSSDDDDDDDDDDDNDNNCNLHIV